MEPLFCNNSLGCILALKNFKMWSVLIFFEQNSAILKNLLLNKFLYTNFVKTFWNFITFNSVCFAKIKTELDIWYNKIYIQVVVRA